MNTMNKARIQGRYSKQWLSRYYQLLNLIRIHKPRSIVEVGTYDGLRACGMIEEAIRHHQTGVTYTGYDLFETATAETDAAEFNVRAHPTKANVQNRLDSLVSHFGGRFQYRLIRGNTRETLRRQQADFAFVDGGHSVETIQSDYEALQESGVVVLDDFYEKGRSGAGPDITKVGCNSLVAQLDSVHVLSDRNPVSGGGHVRLAVRFGADRLRGVRVRPDGPRMPYFFHEHNCGNPASLRRTERTVELALGLHWLKQVSEDPKSKPVEIGAVTPYYLKDSGYTVPVVIDPADKLATEKVSMFSYDISGLDVLSISTIEHVGDKQYGLNEPQTPLDAFQFIASNANRFLVTFPHGWANSANLQQMLFDHRDTLKNDGISLYTLTRQPNETWEVSEDLKPYGNRKNPWANTLIVLERGGFL